MWFVRLLVILVINVAVIFFAVANLGVTVTLHWWDPDSAGTRVNLMLALLVAYVVGFLTYFVISVVREIRLRRKCARLTRQLAKMREELDALRMAPLETTAPTREPTPPGGAQA